MFSMQFAIALIAIGVCLVSACIDHKKGIIPNHITYSTLLMGFVFSFVSSGWHGVWVSGAGAFATALIPLLLFRCNAMGGGDVKLFAALGALLGVDVALQIMMMSFVIGAVAGVHLWARTGVLKERLQYLIRRLLPNRWRWQNKTLMNVEPTYIRFGPSIFFACVLVVGFYQVEQAGYGVL